MKQADVFPSRFVAAADLKGKEVSVTVDRVELETFEDRQKPIVYFKDAEKGLVVNKTNFASIAAICGDDTDDWPGKDITLFGMMVSFKGSTTEAIRVKRPPAAVPAPPTAATAGANPQHDAELNDSLPF